MQPEYEVHNFDTNNSPRRYEAVHLIDKSLVVKVVVTQNRRQNAGRDTLRWSASAYAWMPGQGNDNYIGLVHLETHEIHVRDVIPHEATEEIWLSAARADRDLLMERAQVFAGVLVLAS